MRSHYGRSMFKSPPVRRLLIDREKLVNDLRKRSWPAWQQMTKDIGIALDGFKRDFESANRFDQVDNAVSTFTGYVNSTASDVYDRALVSGTRYAESYYGKIPWDYNSLRNASLKTQVEVARWNREKLFNQFNNIVQTQFHESMTPEETEQATARTKHSLLSTAFQFLMYTQIVGDLQHIPLFLGASAFKAQTGEEPLYEWLTTSGDPCNGCLAMERMGPMTRAEFAGIYPKTCDHECHSNCHCTLGLVNRKNTVVDVLVNRMVSRQAPLPAVDFSMDVLRTNYVNAAIPEFFSLVEKSPSMQRWENFLSLGSVSEGAKFDVAFESGVGYKITVPAAVTSQQKQSLILRGIAKVQNNNLHAAYGDSFTNYAEDFYSYVVQDFSNTIAGEQGVTAAIRKQLVTNPNAAFNRLKELGIYPKTYAVDVDFLYNHDLNGLTEYYIKSFYSNYNSFRSLPGAAQFESFYRDFAFSLPEHKQYITREFHDLPKFWHRNATPETLTKKFLLRPDGTPGPSALYGQANAAEWVKELLTAYPSLSRKEFFEGLDYIATYGEYDGVWTSKELSGLVEKTLLSSSLPKKLRDEAMSRVVEIYGADVAKDVTIDSMILSRPNARIFAHELGHHVWGTQLWSPLASAGFQIHKAVGYQEFYALWKSHIAVASTAFKDALIQASTKELDLWKWWQWAYTTALKYAEKGEVGKILPKVIDALPNELRTAVTLYSKMPMEKLLQFHEWFAEMFSLINIAPGAINATAMPIADEFQYLIRKNILGLKTAIPLTGPAASVDVRILTAMKEFDPELTSEQAIQELTKTLEKTKKPAATATGVVKKRSLIEYDSESSLPELSRPWKSDFPTDAEITKYQAPWEAIKVKSIMEETGFNKEKATRISAAIDDFTTGGDWAGIRDVQMTLDKANPLFTIAEDLEEYIAVAPKWTGPIYRGLSFDSEQTWNRLRRLKPGESFDMLGLSSWSLDEGAAELFMGEGKYSVLISCKNPDTAALVSHYIIDPGAKEVIVSGKSAFKIKHLKVDTVAKQILVDVEEETTDRALVASSFKAATKEGEVVKGIPKTTSKMKKPLPEVESEYKTGDWEQKFTEARVNIVMEDTGLPRINAEGAVLAIDQYSESYYASIRQAQRMGRLDTPSGKLATAIEDYIEAAPKWVGDPIYRKMSWIESDQWNKYIALKEGEKFDMMGLSSWTTDMDWLKKWQELPPYKGYFVCKKPLTATPIPQLSRRPNERELLMSGNSTFKVVSMKVDRAKRTFTMEVEELPRTAKVLTPAQFSAAQTKGVPKVQYLTEQKKLNASLPTVVQEAGREVYEKVGYEKWTEARILDVMADTGYTREKATEFIDSYIEYSMYSDFAAAIKKAQRQKIFNHAFSQAEAIEGYIADGPKWRGGPIYRKLSFTDRWANKALSSVKSGQSLDLQGLTSWSSSKQFAKEFQGPANFEYLLVCEKPITATPVAHLSLFQQEELLMSGYSTARVNKVYKEGKLTIIEVEEVPSVGLSQKLLDSEMQKKAEEKAAKEV